VLRVYVTRGGEVGEIIGFLKDLRRAYESLLQMDLAISVALDSAPAEEPPASQRARSRSRSSRALQLDTAPTTADQQLLLRRVLIESPGFWEFLGSLNPLQQLREYLKDRHERRKDTEWREREERARMSLENDKIGQENRKIYLDNELLEAQICRSGSTYCATSATPTGTSGISSNATISDRFRAWTSMRRAASLSPPNWSK
jgi:hypothetical protein